VTAPAILLMGPTGAGKSSVAIEIAERCGAEIVSVDSALVYRGLDIGTAKPERSAREHIPHHLIDILDPAETYSAGQFLRDAGGHRRIPKRGRWPPLVGGTMYFHALLHGSLSFLKPIPSCGVADERGAAGHRGPACGTGSGRPGSRGTDSRRSQRTQRALRCSTSPVRPSRAAGRAAAPTARHGRGENRDVSARRAEPPAHRATLPRDGGWFLDEVRALRSRGDLSAALPSCVVGYRQLWRTSMACTDSMRVCAADCGDAAPAKRQDHVAADRSEAHWIEHEFGCSDDRS
jgi:tRNA dimethylallyltransferase